jgi:hypothetical protein
MKPEKPVAVVRLDPSRELCGTTPEQFADLLVRLAALAEEARRARQDRPGRRRAPGAGQKGAPFRLRLLVALTHLRHGLTTRGTAAVFGVHERSVRNWRDEVEALLAAHGCQPPGAPAPIRTLDDLRAHLDGLGTGAVLVDGTDVARSRPRGREAQRAAWSHKAGRHAVKATVLADAGRRPLWFEANPSGEGRTHDVAMLRSQLGLMAVLAATAACVVADRGYTGLDRDLGPERVVVPAKATPRRPLDDGDRAYNHDLAVLRMPVEHAIGRMKWWRALREWRRAADRFDRAGKAVAVLAGIC